VRPDQTRPDHCQIMLSASLVFNIRCITVHGTKREKMRRLVFTAEIAGFVIAIRILKSKRPLDYLAAQQRNDLAQGGGGYPKMFKAPELRHSSLICP